MSVTGPSYNINAINKLTESALSGAISDDISWHKQVETIKKTLTMKLQLKIFIEFSINIAVTYLSVAYLLK
jgi:hypothetical protein